jgi:hypothetical protein
LTELVDRPVDVPPPARDLHIRLVHEPTIADGVAAGPGGVDEQRSEALHPPIQGDVVNFDPTLGEELLHIAIGEAEPQVPADREDNHLGREPETRER